VLERAFAPQSGFRGAGYGSDSPADRVELAPAGTGDGMAMRSAAGNPNGGYLGASLDDQETVMYSSAQFAPDAARAEPEAAQQAAARPGRRAARIVAIAMVAALAVVALVIFVLVGSLGIGGLIGDHQTSTLLPKPPPTAATPAPPG
jgi:hypothetical protein